MPGLDLENKMSMQERFERFMLAFLTIGKIVLIVVGIIFAILVLLVMPIYMLCCNFFAPFCAGWLILVFCISMGALSDYYKYLQKKYDKQQTKHSIE